MSEVFYIDLKEFLGVEATLALLSIITLIGLVAIFFVLRGIKNLIVEQSFDFSSSIFGGFTTFIGLIVTFYITITFNNVTNIMNIFETEISEKVIGEISENISSKINTTVNFQTTDISKNLGNIDENVQSLEKRLTSINDNTQKLENKLFSYAQFNENIEKLNQKIDLAEFKQILNYYKPFKPIRERNKYIKKQTSSLLEKLKNDEDKINVLDYMSLGYNDLFCYSKGSMSCKNFTSTCEGESLNIDELKLSKSVLDELDCSYIKGKWIYLGEYNDKKEPLRYKKSSDSKGNIQEIINGKYVLPDINIWYHYKNQTKKKKSNQYYNTGYIRKDLSKIMKNGLPKKGSENGTGKKIYNDNCVQFKYITTDLSYTEGNGNSKVYRYWGKTKDISYNCNQAKNQ